MPHPFALPAVGGLSILAAATGVWLGKSAVAEINPVYYDEAETRFHADLAPNRSPDWAQVQVTEYVQAGLADYGGYCLGCIDYPEEYAPAARREPEGVEDGWAASAEYFVEQEEVQPAVIETARNPEWERVERYASYPVTAEDRAEDEADEAALRAEESAGEGDREAVGL